MAKDIISAPRILNNPGAFPPPLQLLIVSASERFLSAGDHRRLFDAVKQWFIIHHRVVLQYRVTLRVPLLQASLKPQLLARMSEVFRSAHFWPAPLQDFLLSRVKLVSGKTQKVKICWLLPDLPKIIPLLCSSLPNLTVLVTNCAIARVCHMYMATQYSATHKCSPPLTSGCHQQFFHRTSKIPLSLHGHGLTVISKNRFYGSLPLSLTIEEPFLIICCCR